MSETNVYFNYLNDVDRKFVHGVLYYLVSKDFDFNGEHDGVYNYVVGDEYKHYRDDDPGISNEKLASVVEQFFDQDAQAIGVALSHGGGHDLLITLSIIRGDAGAMLELMTTDRELRPVQTYDFFISICRGLFERFEFDFGVLRYEEADTPHTRDQFLSIPIGDLHLYSAETADQFGREKLLSVPAFRVEELENDGILLQPCETLGACEKTWEVQEHLGYR